MAREGDYFEDLEPEVMGTNAGDPESGRIFVWTKIGWFERVVGPDGGVAFTWIARSEHELDDILLQAGKEEDLFDLEEDFANHVIEEFKSQTLSLSEGEEQADEAEHPDEESQSYHQHDLELD